MKLDYGDYSFKLPENTELGILRDLFFTDEIIVERKNSLEELSGNYSTERNRIKAEFAGAPSKKVLLIENGTYSKMVGVNIIRTITLNLTGQPCFLCGINMICQ